jgi:hypothetical protein
MARERSIYRFETEEQRKQATKITRSIYYAKNKDKIREKNRIYYQNRKARLAKTKEQSRPVAQDDGEKSLA